MNDGMKYGAGMTIEQRLARLEQISIASSIGTTEGDLIGFDDNGLPARIPAAPGSGYGLSSDTSQTGGVKWRPRASVSLTAPLVSGAAQMGAGADTNITAWQTEVYDTTGMHSGTGDRITVTDAGIHIVEFILQFAGAAVTGALYGFIRHYNSSGVQQGIYLGQSSSWINNAGVTSFANASAHVNAAVGDYFVAGGAQFTGATRAFSTNCRFMATLVA